MIIVGRPPSEQTREIKTFLSASLWLEFAIIARV